MFYNNKSKKSTLILINFIILFLLISNTTIIVSSDNIPNQNITNSNISSKVDLVDLFSKINESFLRDYVGNIEGFGPHPTGSSSLNNLKNYLFNILKNEELDVNLIPWNNKDLSGENIEATLKGKNNDRSVFVICAHYDSVEISPGADDDGSGVSIVLALANILRDYVFNSTIKFVLFSGEEQGLYGSKNYVKNIVNQKINITGVLNLDGVGYASNKEDGNKIRHHSNTQSSWMQEISKNIAQNYYEYIGLEVLTVPHVTYSDHQSFVEEGYDASYLLENTLNPFYHTSEDISNNMNFTYLSKVCKLSMGILISMAELNTTSLEENIVIKIQGGLLTKNGQFSIEIINKNYPIDTSNLSININLESLFKIPGIYKESINWTMKEEIKENWSFKTTNRAYFSGLIKLNVEVKGFNDDIYIYRYQKTYGIILFKYNVLLIPIDS